ncbi:MAG: Amidohydrolase [Firmicutes bacterium ADurb.Bin300]|nr:MAG: Amidohydrolase [Firmicutes bacterium ADurb.Bin300]
MKIIDAHVHIYPDKIAQKASQSISDFYNLDAAYDGKVSTLNEACELAGVSQCLVHSVATNPSQVGSINSFIRKTAMQHPRKFFGFATVHPLAKDIEFQIENAVAAGLSGFKLHPDFQKFFADGHEAMQTFEIIDGRLPVLIHAGDNRKPYSGPERILKLCKAFPNQTVIAAHFGGWSQWGKQAKELSSLGLYVDTSSSQAFISPEKIRELIDIFTSERVLFGTDYPIWNIKNEIEMLNRILRDATEAEKIYHLNFEKLMSESNNKAIR